MSGHNKWSTIKHKKANTDKKRGQIFSKLSKAITMAAKRGVDPVSNPQLSQAIEKAKSMNMPKDNIERAIKKVSDKSSVDLCEITIEALGPENIAIRIKAITDNKNRTISELKKIFNENNVKMVPPGSIAWMFNQLPKEMSSELSKNNLIRILERIDDNDDVEDIVTNTE
jgi:YebC/PmpR family DNA-binding regulatory protein